jgi:hypothetical protein
MCLVASMSWFSTALVCVAVGWVALGIGRRMFRCSRTIGVAMLAVASIVGGLVVFGSHHPQREQAAAVAARFDGIDRDVIARRVERQIADRIERHRVVVPHIDVPDPDSLIPDIGEIRVQPRVRFSSDFPFADGKPAVDFHEQQASPPHWMLIALGAVLVIGGWLLFNRNHARPVAMKAVTLLGLAATGFVLVSYFGHSVPRRANFPADVVVKDATGSAEVRQAAAAEKPQRAKRPSRAKRPIARADGPEVREDTLDQLPPRAGEIPVDAELAKTTAVAKDEKSQTEPAADATEQPTAEPPRPSEPAAANESPPAASADPAPVAAPSKPESTPEPPEQPEKPRADQPAEPPAAAAKAAPAAEAAETKHVEPAEISSEVEEESTGTRPEWVEMHGKLVGSVYRISVPSGLYMSVPECQRKLIEEIKREADLYIEQFLGEGTAELVDIDRNYLNKHVKKAEFDEVRHSTVGPGRQVPMHQMHALLEFNDAARAEFHDRWRRAIVNQRLWYIGSGGAVVLALLSTFYGYLKLDLQTGGTHKGRLQLAATLLALVITAGALLARWALPF